ncbi:MAG: hypothetical protein EHM64_13005 [Ignavibacteriae bacterium]|nr:MAG: hypothetical protein EHM64_13005 [Ignavibacteriota bacterium]
MLIIFGIVQNSVFADEDAGMTLQLEPINKPSEDLKSQNSANSVFRIVGNDQSVPILYDKDDAAVVGLCTKALATDIERITDILPPLVTTLQTNGEAAIIAGTLGKSKPIDAMVKTGKLSVNSIEGKWESFLIQVVDHPLSGINRALVICGSDPRGTAFGIFDLSKRMGVSPWVYWADVIPAKQKNLDVAIDKIIMGPPSVKYRGIFLNDEDWGLKPWAAGKMDTDIGDIGPRSYARIFELMLRLKANYIWPAMHPCTKAFFYYKENPKIAAQYDIVLGSSHCEPMLRNNVDEWKNNFAKEYGRQPGPWRYDSNASEINRYWGDRVKQAAGQNRDAVFTVGMRGIHDSGLPGPVTMEGKVHLLNKIIEDQRNLLAKYLGTNSAGIPQIFCPYKEVLDIYNAGATIPDDVTMVWADDNHGYIRKLSTAKEQLRSRGSGVYYHLSYWGAPEDYLWLCSTSPSLISYEMSKAYAYGADRLWIFNVGDIKPAEMEIEFAMDLAWNVHAWKPENAAGYAEEWSARTFGKEYAKEIADIKTGYYYLAASGKPEHIDRIKFSEKEMNERLAAYEGIARKAEDLKHRIPDRLKDAYFQLILYPVLGAECMNKKHFSVQMGDAEQSKQAYEEIKKLTEIYNKVIAGGKWNGIMSMSPRNRPVFGMPEIKNRNSRSVSSERALEPVRTISVREFTFDSTRLHLVSGLGADSVSLSWTNFNDSSYSEEKAGSAPSASIKLELPNGRRMIELRCVPTHAVHEKRALRTAIGLGDQPPAVVDVNTPSGTEAWSKNVIRGYSSAKTEFILKEKGMITLQLSLLDPGLAISKILIY